jgi:hypothetical protein
MLLYQLTHVGSSSWESTHRLVEKIVREEARTQGWEPMYLLQLVERREIPEGMRWTFEVYGNYKED